MWSRKLSNAEEGLLRQRDTAMKEVYYVALLLARCKSSVSSATPTRGRPRWSSGCTAALRDRPCRDGETLHARADVDTDGKDSVRHRDAGAAETVALTDDGEWYATGQSRTLDETLDDLSPDYDYVLVEGIGREHPESFLGDREAADPVIHRTPHGADADLDDNLTAMVERDPSITLETLVAE